MRRLSNTWGHLGGEMESLASSHWSPSATLCFSMTNVFAVEAEGQNFDAASFGAQPANPFFFPLLFFKIATSLIVSFIV